MDKVIELLRETGAMLEGHFLLSSGRHSDKYFQCAKLLQHPQKASSAFEGVVETLRKDMESGKIKIDFVVGPAMGGIIAAWEVARQLGLPAIFTERDENQIMILRRGFELPAGSNVLIVEDVITTGKSFTECAKAIEVTGAKVTSVACVVDRRAQDAQESQWPLYPAVKIVAETWDASDCKLCKEGLPVVKPGSRKI